MEHKDKIIITGANGFVGSSLVKILSSRGYNIVPLVRKAVSCELAPYIAIGDYCDFNEWDSLMPGVDVIVHLAAKVHQPGDAVEENYLAINVDVSKKIALAARRCGVRRFIYLSTVKVNGELTRSGDKFSGTGQASPKDAYGRFKVTGRKNTAGCV